MTDRPRLLLIDDEVHVTQALHRALRLHFGPTLRVESRNDPLAALDLARVERFDVVISDYRMPGINGLEFLRRLCEIQPHVVRMVLSASADLATVLRAVNEVGVFRYLVKPWQSEQLVEHVGAALKQSHDARAERELADAMRVQRGELGAAEAERRRLEEYEPGITHVEWGPQGEVLMPPLPRP